jgi:hypothetical protein
MNTSIRISLLLAICLALPVLAGDQTCDRVVAIGDLHGGYDAFVQILQRTGIIDDELNWHDKRACLVQTGDVLDRGARSAEILDLLIALKRQAPQRVWTLLGNHETMNLSGDLRYVSEGEFAAFAAEERPADRAAGLVRYNNVKDRQGTFDALRPPGWYGHQRAFAKDGRYGAWLLGNPGLAIINRSLFVHGGISLPDAARGIEPLNREIKLQLLEYNRLRALLTDCGWWDPFLKPRDAVQQLRDRIASTAEATESAANRQIAEQLVALYSEALFRSSDGPMWRRTLALGDDKTVDAELDQLLKSLDVDRIVVGHSTTDDFKIQSRSAGRLYMIDTGAGPAYEGQGSALELSRSGVIREIYASDDDESEMHLDAELPFPAEAPLAIADAAGDVDRTQRIVVE